MKFILIVILANGGFSAEFNNKMACNAAGFILVKRFPDTVMNFTCRPKGEDSVTAAARTARDKALGIVKEITDGD